MSDFLQTLIARNRFAANAPPSVLQPRLPALFESLDTTANGPSVRMETTEGQTSAAQTTPIQDFQPEREVQPRYFVDRLDPTPTPQPDRRLKGETPFNPGSIRLNPASEITTPDRAAATTIHTPEVGSARQSVPTPSHFDQAPGLPEPIRLDQAPAPLEARRSIPVRPQDTIVPVEHGNASPQWTPQPGTLIHPATLPVRQVSKPVLNNQAQANSMEPVEQETTVYVHIGRIDVRAVASPAPNQTIQRVPKSKPTLSLDDYLKQRSEGKR